MRLRVIQIVRNVRYGVGVCAVRFSIGLCRAVAESWKRIRVRVLRKEELAFEESYLMCY